MAERVGTDRQLDVTVVDGGLLLNSAYFVCFVVNPTSSPEFGSRSLARHRRREKHMDLLSKNPMGSRWTRRNACRLT